jgi:beta-lactamase class D
MDCPEWPADRMAMVMAHEEAHARRRDSIVQLLSLINRAVFWFHPLAWWLHRELGTLAEEACDVAAASGRYGRAAYADCLIAIARAARRSGTRVDSAAIAMASTALHRRVRAILAAPPPAPRRMAVATMATAALLIACLTATPAETMAALGRDHGSGDPFRGFDGTFVLIDDRGSLDVGYNAERADIRVSPCSTFKLPFAALFLDTGIVNNPHAILKYDARAVSSLGLSSQPASAHDQTLTSAFQESANWYFDTVSRSMDMAVVERFAERAGYGNAAVRGAAASASYWYDGRLRISPREQVRFLQRLHNGELGLSARTTAMVKQVAQVDVTPRWRMGAKTGACQGTGETTTTTWYVGWVEKADDTYYSALLLTADDFDRALRERIAIARHFLTDLHILE